MNFFSSPFCSHFIVLWLYSAETNEELRSKGAGFHLYLFPKNAADVPRVLTVLGKRLVLAGYGRVEISRAGSLLERTLADLLVGSPERLDFVAGAVCDKGGGQSLNIIRAACWTQQSCLI